MLENNFAISELQRKVANIAKKNEAYKWINRRSQKKSLNLKQFTHYLQVNPLPKPRICYSLYTK